MSKIKNCFIHCPVDSFINTDIASYKQLVIVTEIALKDLDQYKKSIKQQNLKELDVKLILA